MSFPKYPEVKDSGVEWLGEVPVHWKISRLGFEAWVRARLGWKGLKAEEYVDDGYVFLSTPNIKGRIIDFDNVNYINQQRFDESPEIKLHAGDVLLAKDGSTLGTVNLVRSLPRQATVNSSIAVLTPCERLDGLFLRYLFESKFMRCKIESVKGGMGVPHLFQADLNKFYLPMPSAKEQSTIATFLDHETARIDALVEEQQRLIELLKEKRQAVISHAVTKGLDPDVPMKDSGVEWLGEVPAHWVRKRLKNVSPFITVGIVVNPSSYLAEEGLPFIYGGEVREGYIEVDKARKISLEDSRRNRKTMLEADDVVTMRVGYPGVTAVVPPECEGGNCASVMLVKKGGYDSRWLCAAMNSRLIRHQVEIVQYGAAQKQFNIADAVEFWLFEPPVDEQVSIADFIDRESLRFDQLMDESKRNMELLKERRSALISAAVTGKIDVRGWHPPAGSPAPASTQTETV